MKRKVNTVQLVVSLIIILVSILVLLLQQHFWNENVTLCNVLCGLIGSGVMLLITTIFVDYKTEYDVWNIWRLERIFSTRVEKNQESDPKLRKHNISKLDAVAFGLSNFRAFHTNDIQNCLNHGMNIRLLVMNPTGVFVSQREKEEGDAPGNIAGEISQLVEWARELNHYSSNGKIEVKFYTSMTLDFYWRLDDELYVGPYMYKKKSQQTITYKYVKGGTGFDLYTSYFEDLWKDPSNILAL